MNGQLEGENSSSSVIVCTFLKLTFCMSKYWQNVFFPSVYLDITNLLRSEFRIVLFSLVLCSKLCIHQEMASSKSVSVTLCDG